MQDVKGEIVHRICVNIGGVHDREGIYHHCDGAISIKIIARASGIVKINVRAMNRVKTRAGVKAINPAAFAEGATCRVAGHGHVRQRGTADCNGKPAAAFSGRVAGDGHVRERGTATRNVNPAAMTAGRVAGHGHVRQCGIAV